MEKVTKIEYGNFDYNKLAEKIFKYCLDGNELDENCAKRLQRNAPIYHSLLINTDKNKECGYQLSIKVIFSKIRITKKRIDALKVNLEKNKDKIIGLDFDYNNGNPNTFIIQMRDILLINEYLVDNKKEKVNE